MAVDTKQILDEAEKVGGLLAQHPAIEKYKAAQKSIADDPEANRLLQDFDRMYQTLAQQEMQGMSISDAQRMQLESMQTRIAGHIKIKAYHLAQMEFVDLLRKVSQALHKPLAEISPMAGAAGGGGQRLVM